MGVNHQKDMKSMAGTKDMNGYSFGSDGTNAVKANKLAWKNMYLLDFAYAWKSFTYKFQALNCQSLNLDATKLEGKGIGIILRLCHFYEVSMWADLHLQKSAKVN